MDLNYTPFYERFQDDLAGATATLSIVVPNSINECIAPFNPEPLPPVTCIPTLTVFSTNQNEIDYVRGPGQGFGLRYEDPLTANPAIGIWSDEYLQALNAGSYELEITTTFEFAEPTGNEQLAGVPHLKYFANPPGVNVEIAPTCDSGNWPTVWSADPITYNAIYNLTLEQAQSFISINSLDNGGEYSDYTQKAGGTLDIGFDGVIPAPLPVVTETTVLEFTQGATQQEVYKTNAAYNFESHTTDDTYLSQSSYSNFTNNQFTSFEANLQFDGELLYQTLNGFDPANYQMAIYNSTSNQFLGMTDLPTNDGVVSLTSSTFTFPAGYGNYYLSFYEIGTPNPQDNPPGVLKPLKFSNSTFKINVIS